MRPSVLDILIATIGKLLIRDNLNDVILAPYCAREQYGDTVCLLQTRESSSRDEAEEAIHKTSLPNSSIRRGARVGVNDGHTKVDFAPRGIGFVDVVLGRIPIKLIS
ncbi:hypothetical protein BASA60_000837 [Batrachochytrium salamandrivorans]|nr:hypothetical protein BASA60_000837 [Batrachochytrium salamandrivorans]